MRLFQLVALAAFALIAFKLIGLAAEGAFEGLMVREAAAQGASAQNAPENKPAQAQNGQEQQAEAKAPAQNAAREDAKPTREIPASDQGQAGVSGDSRSAILERLSERREEIDQRERDLKLREELLQAAEKRLKAKLDKIDQFEKDKLEGKPGTKSAKENVQDLVVIYESMKPKDAARIFDALSIDILYQLASTLNPRKMSAILAEMDVKAAERLTVELAARALQTKDSQPKRTLPKIGG